MALNEKQIAKAIEIGGNRWQNYGYDRIYFNEKAIEEILDIRYRTSNSGWRSNITIGGTPISGCKYRESYACITKFYLDVNDGKCHWTNVYGSGSIKHASEHLADRIHDEIADIA